MFFTTDELRSLPYPTEDVSRGPVAEPPVSQSSDIQAIMSLLIQQKADSDDRNRMMLDLQKQVSNLMTSRLPAVSSSYPTIVTTQTPSYTQTSTTAASAVSSTFSLPPTVPSVIASAAGLFGASMQNNMPGMYGNYPGLGITNTYTGLAGQPQFPPVINQQPQHPVNNPLEGMGAALGFRKPDQVISSVDQLYAATVKCKQLRAHEFAANNSQFTYKSQLNSNNCNAVVFAYGSLKHLEAIMSGLIPNVPESELIARVKHLKNVFEIVCLSSNLATFAEPAWQIAREYDNRIIGDIESGAKTWQSLSNGLEVDALYVAKEVTELRNKNKKAPKSVEKSDSKVDTPKKDPKTNGCTTYNTHRSSEGCYPGNSCVFEHFCTWCKTNRNAVEKHKSTNCEHKTD